MNQDAQEVEALRKSLLRITGEDIMARLPYGTVIVAKAHDAPGIHTLIKTDQEQWCSFTVFGNPATMEYQVELEESFVPALPALLVCCGDEMPPPDEPLRKFVLIQGEAEGVNPM